jgi:pSer/pThr/pTyr-binding forkhead associated (FHA) protein
VARLIVRKGEKAGTEYALDGHSLILGRSKKCDIQVASVKASRKHAEIYATGGTFHLRDLQSKNGTFLNRRPLEGSAVLRSGDKFRIGHNILEFVDENAPPAPPPADNFATVVEPAPDQPAPVELVDPGAPDYKLIAVGVGAILALVLAVILGYVAITKLSATPPPAESTPPTTP